MGCGGIKKKHHELVNFHEIGDWGDVPKGCLAVKIKDDRRFVIPVVYINHPLFMELLKEAEEEYGFDHSGPITIPCHLHDFLYVHRLIHQDLHLHHHHHNLFLS